MIRLLVLVGWLLLVFPLSAAAPRGVVPSVVSVRGPQIRWSEVVQLSGDDGQLGVRLSDQALGTSPAPGSAMSLTRASLQARLEKAAGRGAATWEIPERVVIRREAQTVTRAALQDAVTEAVGGSAKVQLVQAPERTLVPVGALALSAQINDTPRSDGLVALRVAVSVDGQAQSAISVLARVSAEARVLVPVRAIAAGAVLGAADFREELRPVAGDGWVTDDRQLVGRVATRALKPGSPVPLSAVEALPAVRRGDPVLLVVRSGALVVTANGVAQQDGRVGDTVSVLNELSAKMVRGQVVGDGEVQVLYRRPTVLSER